MSGNIFDDDEYIEGDDSEVPAEDLAGQQQFVRLQDIVEVLNEPMESVQTSSRMAVKQLFLGEKYVQSTGAGMIQRSRFDVFIDILHAVPELMQKGIRVRDLKKIQEKLKEVRDYGAS